jgi:lipoprotein-releasing system permease protein
VYKTFLSWRYLLGRPTNLVGIVGLFISVGALVLILSIMTGFLEESKNAVRGGLSDFVIEPLIQERADGRRVPDAPERLLACLRADPRVASAAPHLAYAGMLTDESDVDKALAFLQNSKLSHLPAVRILGVDAADEAATTGFGRAIARDPRPGSGARVHDPSRPFEAPPEHRGRPIPALIVGEQLFDAMGLARGQKVTLYTAVPDPGAEPGGSPFAYNNMTCVVAGTFRSGENAVDLDQVYLDRAALADLLGGVRGYSEVVVRLVDYRRDAAAFKADARFALGSLGLVDDPAHDLLSWQDQRADVLAAIRNERFLIGLMLCLVLVVAAFTIFAILSMMVTEKRRDIGVLAALGATPHGIMALFLMIGFWDWLIGASLGAAAGVWMALRIDAIELWLSRTFGVQIFDRTVYFFDYIPAVVEPRSVALIALGALGCSLAFALVPAWRAARVDPVAALRYE